MEGAEAIIEDTLTCAFCLEILRDPKTLPCGHNFCGQCLQQYLTKRRQTDQHLRVVTCPQCREDTPIPDPSKPVIDWANQFKTNCAIQNVIDGLSKRFRRECGICECEGNKVKSDFYCKTCDLSLCRSCYAVHRRIPASASHDVQQWSKEPAPTYHSYDFKVHLDTASSTRQRKQQRSRVKAEVENKIDVICQKLAESLKEKQRQLSEQASTAVDYVFDRFDASYPVDVYDVPSGSLGEDSSSDEDSVDDHRLLASIRLASKVESFINSRYDVAIARIHTDADFRDEESTGVKETASGMESFSDDSKIVETEEIHMSPCEDDDGSSSDFSDDMKDRDEDFTPVHQATIQSVTDEDDNDPWIRNILVMTSCDTETIVVTDYNNMCVKSFYKEDEEYLEAMPHRISRLALKGKPWGVSELQNERIAVTCPDKKLICTIRVNPDLTKLSETSVPKAFYGLGTLNSSTLVASAPKESPPGLYILDFSGRILKAIVTDRINREMFESPYYITMSVWGDILVAEEKARMIQYVTKEGLIRAKSSSGEGYRLSSLYGIACSKAGSVFVADREGNKVVWVREGKDDKVFLCDKDGIFFPRCLDVYRQESMFVAEEGGAIKKFKLSAK